MSSEVERQLVDLLQALLKLKPPGASKGKIADITRICVENVNQNAMIVETLNKHFQTTPPTHKLGVLFVVDSVSRQWIEKAKQAGQSLSDGASAEDSFAAAVNRMSQKVTSLVSDMIRNVPADQKAKVTSLVDIWRRGNTFPSKISGLESICKSAPPSHVPSRTPPGSPPPALIASLGLKSAKSQPSNKPAIPVASSHQPPPPASIPKDDVGGILAALAKMASQTPHQIPASASAAAPAPAATQTQAPSFPVYQNQMPQALSTMFGIGPTGIPVPPQATHLPIFATGNAMQFPPAIPPSQSPAVPPPFPFAPPAAIPHNPPSGPGPSTGLDVLSSLIPPHILSDPTKLTQVLTLFQELLKAGVPQDQWGPVIDQLYPQGQRPVVQPPTPSWQPPSQPSAGYQSNGGPREGHTSTRRRSRSPDRYQQRGNEINRRGSPVYGQYNAPGAGNDDQSPGTSYRQRSPLGARNGDSNMPAQRGQKQSKWTDLDRSIPTNHIKVLSRTLFVGGANGTDQDLRKIFSRFGEVQTCVVNNDKRHAFVKMFTREDAVRARAGMENNQDPSITSKARQTRWGVGFGPRDCCDYATGESIIPIDRLTDADHKWVVSAEWGGTGGRPVESGLVMEEPDIEIGAGVSSKAMSSRVRPDGQGKRGGRHDNHSHRGGGHGGHGGQCGNHNQRGGGFRGGHQGGGHHNHHHNQQQQQQQQFNNHSRGERKQSPQRRETANVQPPPEVPQFGSFQMPALGS